MREYQNISLDRFDGLNLKSTVYFLSHCHCGEFLFPKSHSSEATEKLEVGPLRFSYP